MQLNTVILMSIQNKSICVLFVCMGNICRSPTGEGVFRHYVREAGHDHRIHIESAGILSYHAGDPADSRMRAAASRRGYVLDSIARQITPADVREYDLIIPMDHDNLDHLERMAGGPSAHIRLLGSFINDVADNQLAAPVPDPYYGSGQGFETVLDMIESACPAMLDHCLALLQEK